MAVDKPSQAEVRDTEVRLFLSGVRRSVADHVNSLVFGGGMTTAEACEAVRTETERVLTLMGKEKGETRGDTPGAV